MAAARKRAPVRTDPTLAEALKRLWRAQDNLASVKEELRQLKGRQHEAIQDAANARRDCANMERQLLAWTQAVIG